MPATMRLHQRTARLALLALAAATCSTTENPDVCDNASDCASTQTCDTSTHLCVAMGPDASAPDAGKDAARADGHDGPAPDGPTAPDAPADLAPDLLEFDAPGSCAEDKQCPPALPLCLHGVCARCTSKDECVGHAGSFCVSGNCVECLGNTDCAATPERAFCVDNACVGCGSAGDVCRAPTPGCASSGLCVECTDARHCAAPRSFCSSLKCVGCKDIAGACKGTTPVCDADGTCVECGGNQDCGIAAKSFCVNKSCAGCGPAGGNAACAARGAAAPVCAPDGNCVECLASADCNGAPGKPICDTGRHVCIPCTTDGQCAEKPGPGVCMFHQDGRCASDAETIYVQYSDACAANPARDGSAGSPFCTAQAGMNAASGAKRLVVMMGPMPLQEWSAGPAGAQLTVVGNAAGTPTIRPGGSNPGIRITAGDVYIRNLNVLNGANVGVVAESGTTLRLDRCTIKNNDFGGIQVKDGAAFDIVNTVVAENSASGLVGGVTLPAVAAGKPKRFLHNTVVGNRNGAGVICAQGSGQLLQGSILFGNAGPAAQHIDCSPVTCCGPGDPLLTTSQRLMSGSPCKDKLDPMMSLPYDIDGDPRPQNGLSDCGADELK